MSSSNFLSELKQKSGWNHPWKNWHPNSQKLVKLFPLLLLVIAIPLTVRVAQEQQIFQQFARTSNPCAISGTTFTPSSSTFSIVSGPDATLKPTEATITWNLCDYGTGIVDYGTTTSYGLTSRFENTFNYKFHLQTISNLKPGTTYHFRVTSKNKAGATVISADNVFTTPTNLVDTSTPTPVLNSTSPTQVPTSTTGPTPTPNPVSSGIPALPALVSGEWRKNFADGTLTPLRVLTYPDDHIGQAGQYMTVYNRFSNGSHQFTIHDGYADLRATKRSDGLWDAVMLGTSQSGVGPLFGYGRYEFAMRANVGRATWQSGWLYDTKTWTATEIDWPEMLENKNLSAHIIGQGAGGAYQSPPSDWATVWHVFYIDREPGYVAFGIDGIEKYRKTASMPSTPLAILIDSKIGFPWAEGPDSSTPNPTWLQVAWIRYFQP